MKEDKFYNNIQKALENLPENFNILEEQIDIEIQMQYFEFSRKVRDKERFKEFFNKKDELFSEEADEERKKEILSVLATRPNVTEGKFSKKDVEDKKVNLLFFGNFHKMSLPEFEWAIGELMKDKDYLYSSMTKDLYFLGKVLNRKYKILRITYLVFMIGIIVSVLAFAFAFKMQETGIA